MTAHRLTFHSAEKLVGLSAPSSPHQETIGEWRISESLVPCTYSEHQKKGLGKYKLSLECMVTTDEEAWTAFGNARKLTDEIDTAWCYAWGHPFHSSEMKFVPLEAPKGWSGNYCEVKRAIQQETGGLMVAASQFVSHNWVWLPCFPLKRVLIARAAYVSAAPVIRELIQLHVRSHKASDSQLFLLAKSLEIIGAFFRVSDSGPIPRAIRNSGIQSAMQKIGVESEMTQTVEWLFDIGNERFDVRHAWDKDSPGVVLHPRLTEQERKDFLFNADLVVRAFVCDQLNVDVPIQTGKPPKPGRWVGDVLEFDS